jgi:apolipoprotein N-acyltransferase
VVWGESSVSFDLGSHPRLRDRLAALSSKVGSPILVNVDARRSDRPGIYKSSILLGPEGPIGRRYDKNRLVPFGEYVPARSLLGWATSVGRAAGEDRLRGDGPVMMRGSGVKFGPLVCFESAFPDMSRQLALDGARLIVTQSSTSTFQHSWAPAQHASLAALRAAETGRPMVHATLTGVSAVYGPRGERIGPWLGTDRHTAEVYKVPLATGSTLYLRTGDWIVHAAVAALVVYGAVEGVRVFRRRGTGGSGARGGPGERMKARGSAKSWPPRDG